MSVFTPRKRSCISIPSEVVTELDKTTLEKLCVIDLKKPMVYPIYLDASDKRFKLVSYKGLSLINPKAYKEINFSCNQLTTIDGLDECSKLKRLYIANNLISSFTLKSHPNLQHLDLTSNKLTLLPNLNGCPNLKVLLLQKNKLETCDMKNIEKCINLETIDLSSNSISFTKQQLEDVFSILKNMKKLTTLDFSDNLFNSNLVNYKGSFLSRLKTLSMLNGEVVSRRETASYKAPVQILFANEVKQKLENTSATMKGAPSFIPFLEKEKNTFYDLIEVVKYTAEEYYLGCADKMCEIFLDRFGEGKMIQSEGMEQFIILAKTIMESMKNIEPKRIWAKCLFLSLLFCPDEKDIRSVCQDLLFWLLDNVEFDIVSIFTNLRHDYAGIISLLTVTLQSNILNEDTTIQAYQLISKVLLETFEYTHSIETLSLLADSLESNQQVQIGTFMRCDFVTKIGSILEEEKFKYNSPKGHLVLRLINATSHVLFVEFSKLEILHQITEFKSKNETMEDVYTHGLVLTVLANLARTENGLKVIQDLKLVPSIFEDIKFLVEKDALNDFEIVKLDGLTTALAPIILYTSIGVATCKELFETISIKKLVQHIHDGDSTYKILSFAKSNELVMKHDYNMFLTQKLDHKTALNLLLSSDVGNDIVPRLISIFVDGPVRRANFSLSSKKGLVLQLLKKQGSFETSREWNYSLLCHLKESTVLFVRFFNFSKLCTELISNVEGTDENVSLLRTIFTHEQTANSTRYLGLETKLDPETLFQAAQLLSKGTPLLNRMLKVHVDFLKDPKNHKQFLDLGGLEYIHDMLGQEFRISHLGTRHDSRRLTRKLSGISIRIEGTLRDIQKEVFSPQVLRQLFAEPFFKFFNPSFDGQCELSDLSDLSDIEEDLTNEVTRVHRKSMITGDHTTTEITDSSKIPQAMWSYTQDHTDPTLKNFLSVLNGTDDPDLVYSSMMSQMKRSPVDKEFFLSDFYLMMMIVLAKDQVVLEVSSILRFLTRFSLEELFIDFESVYGALILLEKCLSLLSHKIEERFREMIEICIVLGKICNIIFKKLMLHKQGCLSTFEMVFVEKIAIILHKVVKLAEEVPIVTMEDYTGIAPPGQAKIQKVYHFKKMTALALNLSLKKMIPINIVGLLVTSLAFLSVGVTKEETWSRSEETIEIEKNPNVADLSELLTDVLAFLMKHIDTHIIENIMGLFVRIEEICGISLDGCALMDLVSEYKDDIELGIHVENIHSNAQIIGHFEWNDKMIVIGSKVIFVFLKSDLGVCKEILLQDVQKDDRTIKLDDQEVVLEKLPKHMQKCLMNLIK